MIPITCTLSPSRLDTAYRFIIICLYFSFFHQNFVLTSAIDARGTDTEYGVLFSCRFQPVAFDVRFEPTTPRSSVLGPTDRNTESFISPQIMVLRTTVRSSVIWNIKSLTEITFPRAESDRLILAPSFKRSPVAPVESARSEPINTEK